MSLEKVFESFDVVMGVEVHCQLLTNSKLFCSCLAESGGGANENTCEVCLGLPGSLPSLNKKAAMLAAKFSRAVQGQLNQKSRFVRKQYFYPDLPKGYQISQFKDPICSGGFVELSDGKKIGLDRVQIEEDAGKLIHKKSASFIDLNRAGTPLIEIVSKPELTSIPDTIDYLKTLHRIVRFFKISDGNMEAGNFRMDVNVSLKPRGAQELGTRCEIKNLNSFKFAEKAIEFEIERQAEVLESGQAIRQQTLGYDPDINETFSMRDKEDAHDYRYFNDPDLPTLDISFLQEQDIDVGETPQQLKQIFMSDYNLVAEAADFFTVSHERADYLKKSIEDLQNKKMSGKAASFYMTEIHAKKPDQKNMQEFFPSSSLAQLYNLLDKGELSSKTAKKACELYFVENSSIEEIAIKHKLKPLSDPIKITEIVKTILAKYPEQLSQYQGGKTKLRGFFVGKIMQESGGNLAPAVLNKILDEHLNG